MFSSSSGFILEETETDDSHNPEDEENMTENPKLENYAVEELERTLEKLIAQENYEEAAKVSEILNRKRNDRH